ncbi:calcium/sodium antiporter [Demequina muriae]|uniref:Calcium/sodium antiporter n=1 Tax=Demequina muriae TaxID=3051664 RepID=A0ABT8GEU3_9MICO|nr:calcium/sodium antiporter [Demequina sp. EGI L300058]MDN4479859.1 calcium/sodium antiporter [Demequina sp. EGI L300058]
MVAPVIATLVGLAILAWSAEKFVMGAATVARFLGMAPLLIGMIVIGFGTSAPEIVVSSFAAAQGTPEIALGNAFGSNIANIGLILGVTAITLPIIVKRGILRKEMPLLIVVTLVAWLLLSDGELSRGDAAVLVLLLIVLLTWSVMQSKQETDGDYAHDVDQETDARGLSRKAAWIWLLVGLVLLVLSSRLLVWGATEIAQELGWSDLVIGLTVVAVGTSAPELASSLAAARKGENDLALGNIIGSNLFNTLGVVGVAGLIAPAAVGTDLLYRDIPMVMLMTVLLLAFGFRLRRNGRINRLEGAVFVALWLGYTAYLVLNPA